MLPFPLKAQVPPALKPYILDYWWDMTKLHTLDLPTEIIPISNLLWHLDLPWWEHGGQVFSLAPAQARQKPEKYPEQYKRTMNANLRHPLIVRKHGGRTIIMDGIHRLLKAHILGKKTIKVKLFDEELLPMIAHQEPTSYEPGIIYQRSPEENRDVFLAWQRPDKAFFASGACHILAHMFLSLHYGEGYELIYIKPKGDYPGNHMYASNGTWAFDFNGWILEEELLEGHDAAYKQAYPQWEYDRMVIKEGLPAYIAAGNHNLRPPEYFPELPWKRAYEYIKQFPGEPPTTERKTRKANFRSARQILL